MKRIRYRGENGVGWGELEGGTVYPLTGLMGERSVPGVMLSEVTLLAPCEPKNIVCVGKNYAKHILEMGGSADLPKEPGSVYQIAEYALQPRRPDPVSELDGESALRGRVGGGDLPNDARCKPKPTRFSTCSATPARWM